MWIFWALLSAVLVASRRPFEKKIIKEMHHFTYGLVVQALSLPPLALLLLFNDVFINPLVLGLEFWLPVIFVSVCFYPLNAFLYKVVMKDGELSKVLPLQSLMPICALGLAWITIGEAPTVIAACGVLLTIAGVYALGLKGRNLHHPLQPFRENASSRAMIVNVVLVAIVSIFDKIAIQASSPLFYGFSSSVGAAVVLLISMIVTRQKMDREVKQKMRRLALISGLQSSTYMTYLIAAASGPIAYVSALRSSNILMGSILGILIFRERITKPKILSMCLIILGAVLLTFSTK